MPHLRNRLVLKSVQKSLKFWPVTSILGPRQCGKSTFLRDLLFKKGVANWVSLDKKADRKLANDNPELFLNRFETTPTIIDEAHKAPDLFDEIKAKVDEKRRSGTYILSGSVYFSKKIGIQESLTGRSSLIRMDTMTLPETLSSMNFSLKELDYYLNHGGMPGVCFIRSKEETDFYWAQWLETTCQRDLKIFSKGRLSSDLAEEILEQCSKLELANVSEIAKKTGVDARRVKTHLDALEDLFVVRRVAPSSVSVGKDIYFPFDCGLANHHGASQRKKWQVGFLVHYYNQQQFSGKKAKPAKYYLTQRHSFIDFELNGDQFHLYCDKPNPARSELMTIAAAHIANPKHSIHVHCATDSFQKIRHENSFWVGWATGWEKL